MVAWADGPPRLLRGGDGFRRAILVVSPAQGRQLVSARDVRMRATSPRSTGCQPVCLSDSHCARGCPCPSPDVRWLLRRRRRPGVGSGLRSPCEVRLHGGARGCPCPSPDVRFGHPALRSLHAGCASPSWLRLPPSPAPGHGQPLAASSPSSTGCQPVCLPDSHRARVCRDSLPTHNSKGTPS